MGDALEYAHVLRHGVRDIRKHRTRFWHISHTVQLLKKLMKLRSYEDLDCAVGWESFVTQQDSEKGPDATKNIRKGLSQAALLLAPSNEKLLEKAARLLGIDAAHKSPPELNHRSVVDRGESRTGFDPVLRTEENNTIPRTALVLALSNRRDAQNVSG